MKSWRTYFIHGGVGRGGILLVLCIILCSGETFVLEAQENKFIPMVFLGGVTSQVDGDGYSGFDKPGIEGGVGVLYHLSDLFDISFEVKYIQKGSRKVPRVDLGDNDYFLMRLHFVDMPLYLSFKYYRFLFQGGAYGGYLMKYYMEDELGPLTSHMQGFKKWETGVFLGVGYQGLERFSLIFRSATSVTPFRDYTRLGTNLDWYNKIFRRGWYNLFLTATVQYRLYK